MIEPEENLVLIYLFLLYKKPLSTEFYILKLKYCPDFRASVSCGDVGLLQQRGQHPHDQSAILSQQGVAALRHSSGSSTLLLLGRAVDPDPHGSALNMRIWIQEGKIKKKKLKECKEIGNNQVYSIFKSKFAQALLFLTFESFFNAGSGYAFFKLLDPDLHPLLLISVASHY